MNLQELKTYISRRLELLSGIAVFDGKAPNDAVFPYVVYSFPSSSFNFRTRTDRILELNFWDNTNDDTEVLKASTQVRDGIFENGVLVEPGLNYSWQSETEGFFKSYIDFEGEIPDPDEISRIQQRYIIQVG